MSARSHFQQDFPLGEIIASRQLLFTGKDGAEIPVRVLVGRPEAFPDSPGHYCPIQVIGLGSGRVKFAGGEDAVQALQLALKRLSAEIRALEKAANGLLRWLSEGDLDLAFPP